MLTIQTCPTSALEELCKRHANPATLEESAILFGAQRQILDRRRPDQVALDNALRKAARKPMPKMATGV